MKNLSTTQYLAVCAASGSYLRGFAAGADPRRSRRRHTLDVNAQAHAQWLRGYEDGRAAMLAAERAFEAEVIAQVRAAAEASP